MTYSIQTNISSQFARRSLDGAEKEQQTSVQRLSSGSRINSAKDDAAGLAIASRMTSAIRSASPLMRGMRDGIGFTEVAQGGLRGVLDALQRARELAVQSANGTLQASDRQALDAEYQQLMGQINQIADTTEAFGLYPLKKNSTIASVLPPPIPETTKHITDVFPTSGTTKTFSSGIIPIAYIPTGAHDVKIHVNDFGADDDIQLFTRNGTHLAGTPLSDAVWNSKGVTNSADIKSKAFLESSGFLDTASYDASVLLNGHSSFTPPPPVATPLTPLPGTAATLDHNGMEITYSGDGNPSSFFEQIEIDQTTEPILVMVVGSGSFTAKATWSHMPAKGAVEAVESSGNSSANPMQILVSANAGQAASFVNLEKTPSDTDTLGVSGSGIDPFEAIESAMNALDAAIDKVADYCTTHGAVESRLESAMSSMEISTIATSASRSKIMDADFAAESAVLSANQIRTAASSAMLVQANAGPRLVLALFGDKDQQPA